eukprot:scaffold4601_cov122-Skeletonema_menzelii.AAC.2
MHWKCATLPLASTQPHKCRVVLRLKDLTCVNNAADPRFHQQRCKEDDMPQKKPPPLAGVDTHLMLALGV